MVLGNVGNEIGQPTIVSRPIEAIIITVISISTGSISELGSSIN